MKNSNTAPIGLDLDNGSDLFVKIFKYLFDYGSGLWIWEPQNESIFFNNQYATMLGYESSGLPTNVTDWFNLIHSEDHDYMLATRFKIINSPDFGDSAENKFRLKNANGEYIWFIGKAFVLQRNKNGEATHLAGMHIEMSKATHIWNQISLGYERMYFALEASKDGFWDWDPRTDQVYYSPRCYEMLGYNKESFPTSVKGWSELVHPEDLAPTIDQQLQHIDSPRLGDNFNSIYRLMASDNKYRWILGRGKIVQRNAEGRAIRLIGMHTDITELQNNQEHLLKIINSDKLTGLGSRYYLDSELKKIRPSFFPVSVIYCDIDCLKLINDHMGHEYGDNLLRKASEFIKYSIRKNDIAARVGGDEIIIVLTLCPETAISSILDKIHKKIQKHNQNKKNIPIFISYGHLTVSKDMDLHEAIIQADKLMLNEKIKTKEERKNIVKSWIEQQLNKPVELNDSRIE